MEIELPPLHPGQIRVDENSARFKVIVCGRRWGKTKLGVHKCIREAIHDPGLYWWISDTYKHALEGWVTLKEIAFQIPNAKVHEADRYVTLPGKGEVWIMSTDNEGALRGRGPKGAVFDEFTLARESAWTQELRPALSDYRGWCWFIGTPRGRNWGYRLFTQAQYRTGWAAFKEPTSNNPYISKEEIEEAREEMTELEFAQEYLADFGASQYLVYPDFDRSFHCWKDKVPEFISFHGGLDFGGTSIGSHKSVGLIAGRTKDDILIVLNEFSQAGPNIAERQMEWIGEQESLVRILNQRTGREYGIHWKADKTQMVAIQMMRNAGINVWPSKGGPDSVSSGINIVQRRLKIRGDGKARLYYLPHVHFLVDAFERYRYPEPHNDELHAESKNPLKIDDDEMDTIRYLVEGLDRNVMGDPQQLYRNQLAVLR